MTDATIPHNPTADRDHVDLRKKGFGLVTKDGSKSGDREEAVWIHIDDIDCDYTRNDARFPMYEYNGLPCSFRVEDIADLLETLPNEQHQPVEISVNPATRRHELEEGYRRYFTLCVLRDRGIVPKQGYVLLCSKVARRKSGQDHADAIERSGAMQSLKPLSPIDLAHYAEKLVAPLSKNGMGLKEDDARRKLHVLMQHNPNFRLRPDATEIEPQQFQKLRRLTSLERDTKIAVHEGRLKWTKALANASKRGEGNVRGPAGPQTPRGFKPREAVALATSNAFADEIPEMVPRADVLALLHYVGNAETEPPKWLAAAREAFASSKSDEKVKASTNDRPRRAGARGRSATAAAQ